MAETVAADLVVRPTRAVDDAACRAIAARAAMSSYGARLSDAAAAKVADPATPLETVEQRLVAEFDGAVVGFIDLKGSHVENLFVDPTAQGRGIGLHLMQAAESAVDGDMTLSVFTVNPRARAFYERLGYECLGTKLISFFGEPAEVWRMIKRR